MSRQDLARAFGLTGWVVAAGLLVFGLAVRQEEANRAHGRPLEPGALALLERARLFSPRDLAVSPALEPLLPALAALPVALAPEAALGLRATTVFLGMLVLVLAGLLAGRRGGPWAAALALLALAGARPLAEHAALGLRAELASAALLAMLLTLRGVVGVPRPLPALALGLAGAALALTRLEGLVVALAVIGWSSWYAGWPRKRTALALAALILPVAPLLVGVGLATGSPLHSWERALPRIEQRELDLLRVEGRISPEEWAARERRPAGDLAEYLFRRHTWLELAEYPALGLANAFRSAARHAFPRIFPLLAAGLVFLLAGRRHRDLGVAALAVLVLPAFLMRFLPGDEFALPAWPVLAVGLALAGVEIVAWAAAAPRFARRRWLAVPGALAGSLLLVAGAPRLLGGGPGLMLVTADGLTGAELRSGGGPLAAEFARRGTLGRIRPESGAGSLRYYPLLALRPYPARAPAEVASLFPGGAGATLAGRLQLAGWATGAAIASPELGSPSGLYRGFDEFDDNFLLDPAGRRRERAETRRPAADVAARGVRWLRSHHRRPFFLWLQFAAPGGGATGGGRAEHERWLAALWTEVRLLGLDGTTLLAVTGGAPGSGSWPVGLLGGRRSFRHQPLAGAASALDLSRRLIDQAAGSSP